MSLSRHLKSSFFFVYEPFAIKCCTTTQTKALLYIYWLLIINTLFVEQISHQINFLAENNKQSFFSLWRRLDFRSLARQWNRSSFTNMQIWDEPSRLQTLPYNTQGIYKWTLKRGENYRKELKNVGMNFSPTCCQKPQSQCSTMVFWQRNSILQRQKKNYSIHYLAKIRVCPG